MAPGKADVPEVGGHASAVRDRGRRPRASARHPRPLTSELAGDGRVAGGRSLNYKPTVGALRT